MTGKIKSLKQQGFGFIAQEGEKDLFFHMGDLVGVKFEELAVDDMLSFEVKEGEKGMSAVNVQRA